MGPGISLYQYFLRKTGTNIHLHKLTHFKYYQQVGYNITTTVKIFASIKIHHVHQSDTAFVSSRVTSAVAGIMGVINSGSNGSAWIIAGDKPPVEVTTNVREGFKIISMATNLT